MIRKLLARLGWGRAAAPPPEPPAGKAAQGVIPLDPTPPERDIRSIHGAHLLWVIREDLSRMGPPRPGCPGTMLLDLCQRYGVPWNPFGPQEPRIRKTGEIELFEMLGDLMEVGFLELRSPEGERLTLRAPDRQLMSAGFVVTEKWQKAQEALGLSLTEMAALLPGRGGAVQPLFGAPASRAKGPDVYVIMPFAETMKPIYADHIRPTVEGLGYTCMRGDDEFSTHAVMDDIWRHITSARLLVAECTGRNPNVFYEIGIAHTVGIPVIILAQDGTDVPFDVQHIRFIQYAATQAGLAAFDEKLVRTLRYEMGRLRAEDPERRP